MYSLAPCCKQLLTYILLIRLMMAASAPILSLVSVALSTGSTINNEAPIDAGRMRYVKSSLFTGMKISVCLLSQSNTGLMIIDEDGKVKCRAPNTVTCFSVVVKDNLKIFTSNLYTPGVHKYGYSISIGPDQSFAISQDFYQTTGELCQQAMDDNSSNYIICVSIHNSWKVDMSLNGAEGPLVSRNGLYFNAFNCQAMLYHSSREVLVIGKASFSLPVIRKDGLQELINPANHQITDPNYGHVYQLDNLDQDILYTGTNINTYLKQNIFANPLVLQLIASIDVTAYGNTNYVNNLGPYQYLIAPINHASLLPSVVLLIDKLTFTIHHIITPLESVMITDVLFYRREGEEDRYYFAVMDRLTPFSFSSYYFQVDNCTSRAADGRCSGCIEGTYHTSLGSPDSRCLSPDRFPDSNGVDPASLSIVPCEDIRCLQCQLDYRSCTKCSAGYEISTPSNACAKKYPSTLSLQSVRFDAALCSVEVTVKGLTSSLDTASLEVSLTDQSTSLRKVLATRDYSIYQSKEGFSIYFDQQYQFQKRLLTINSNREFTGFYPLLVPDVSCSHSIGGLLEPLGKFITSVGLVTSIALLKSRPSSGSKADRFFSTLFYQRLLVGRPVVHPDRMLKNYVEFSLMPFEVPNLFAEWAADNYPSCSNHEVLGRFHIHCNLLANFGADMLTISSILIINLSVSLAAWMVKSKKNSSALADLKELKQTSSQKPERIKQTTQKTPRLEKYLTVINEHIGINFFFVKLDSMQLEVVGYSMIALLHPNQQLPMMVSTAISVSWHLYYAAVVYMTLTSAHLVSVLVREFKHRFMTLIGFLRSLMIFAAILIFLRRPWVQTSLVLAIELVYLTVLIVKRSKKSHLDNLSDILTSFSEVSFLILKLITHFDISEHSRQRVIGVMMVGCIAFNAAVSVIFLLISFTLMLIFEIKAFCASGKNKVQQNRSLPKLDNTDGSQQMNNSSQQKLLKIDAEHKADRHNEAGKILENSEHQSIPGQLISRHAQEASSANKPKSEKSGRRSPFRFVHKHEPHLQQPVYKSKDPAGSKAKASS